MKGIQIIYFNRAASIRCTLNEKCYQTIITMNNAKLTKTDVVNINLTKSDVSDALNLILKSINEAYNKGNSSFLNNVESLKVA